MNLLKDEVIVNKARLDKLEEELENQISLLQDKQDRWTQIENDVRDIVRKDNKIVTFNVSGKIFSTRLSTLIALKETLFYRLVHLQEYDYSQTIYLDRNPKYFLMILDYLRYQKIDLKKLSKDEKMELRFEAEYFEVIVYTKA